LPDRRARAAARADVGPHGRLTSVSAFLQAIRQHGWDATLPVAAAFFWPTSRPGRRR